MKKLLLGSLFAIACAASLPAAADTITFAGSTEISRAVFSASAVFEINGDNLVITLRNTSPSTERPDIPARTLTGLFWDVVNWDGLLTPFSAGLASGSSIDGACAPTACGQTNVGGEFGYLVRSLQGGSDRFISSTTYGETGFQRFNGPSLNGGSGFNGIDFSIVSPAEGYLPNPALADDPVVMGGVTFRFSGASGLTINDIAYVSFQPGATLGGNYVPASVVPEPASIALLGLGLAGFAAARRRRRSQAPI